MANVAYLYFLVIYWVVFVIFFMLFLARMRQEPLLRSRGVFWSIMIALGGSVDFTLLSLRFYIPDDLSCSGRLISGALISPICYFPFLIRSFSIWYKYRWNEEKLTKDKHWFHDHQWLVKLRFQFLLYLLVLLLHIVIEVIVFTSRNGAYPNVPLTDPACVTRASSLAQTILAIVYVVAAIWLVYLLYGEVNDAYHVKDELKAMLSFILPLFIVYFILAIINPPEFEFYNMLLIIFFITFLVSIVLPVYFSYVDALVLKSSTRWGDSDSMSSQDLIVAPYLKTAQAAAKKPKKQRTAKTPDSAADIKTETVEIRSSELDSEQGSEMESEEDATDYFRNSQTNSRTKSKGDLAAGNALLMNSNLNLNMLDAAAQEANKATQSFGESLADVLTNQVFLDAFTKFCNASWCSENIVFYQDMCDLSAKASRGMYISRDEMERVKSDYLVLGARKQLNLPSRVVDAVLDKINAGSTDPAVLEPVLKAVLILLKNDVFPRFRQSYLWKDAVAAARAQV